MKIHSYVFTTNKNTFLRTYCGDHEVGLKHYKEEIAKEEGIAITEVRYSMSTSQEITQAHFFVLCLGLALAFLIVFLVY